MALVNDTPHILIGPADTYTLPKEHFGLIIFDCLKNRKANDIINIDASTEDVLTCGKLLSDSIKCAKMFQELGMRKGDVITIISENHLNYFIPVLAALYMGIAVNPLNPNYLEEELRRCLNISKPKLILSSEKALAIVLQVKPKLTLVTDLMLIGNCYNHHVKIPRLQQLLDSNLIDDHGDFQPETFDYTEQVAFICCSSGTTGFPKGVQISHQNLRYSIGFVCHADYANITSRDTTIILVPFFHIYGIKLQLLTIVASMKSVLLTKFRPDEFLRSIEEYRVTVLFLVPPILIILAKSPLIDDYNLTSLRKILVGAAPIGKEVVAEAAKRLGSVTIKQYYGLTETTGPFTFQTRMDKEGSVGCLTPGSMVRICDPKTKKSLGPYKAGEICVKGPMVMKGYIPEQDFMDRDGFFHTGDIGYYDCDQFVYIVDRIKELIKYKAFQVSPAELEALIVTHPAVQDCAVIGIPDERAGELARAFCVLKTSVSEQSIIDYVSERISVEKRLYGGVKFVKRIPKNPSGKILRKSLRELI